MKGKIVTLVLLFLASLLFPYTMTILCFDTGLMSYQPEDLYSVVLENEKTVSAEQYLVGILAQEIDPSMEQETLKAQAILARTWLYRAMGTKTSVSESELAIHAMTLSQMKAVWGDDEYLYYEKLYAAVIETAGQCLYYGDGLAAPLFHKISAGMTRYDQTGDCPYLVGVDCVYDAESPGYQTVKQFTKEELPGTEISEENLEKVLNEIKEKTNQEIILKGEIQDYKELNTTDLENLGISKDNDTYIVNYKTGEVINKTKLTTKSGKILYTYSE